MASNEVIFWEGMMFRAMTAAVAAALTMVAGAASGEDAVHVLALHVAYPAQIRQTFREAYEVAIGDRRDTLRIEADYLTDVRRDGGRVKVSKHATHTQFSMPAPSEKPLIPSWIAVAMTEGRKGQLDFSADDSLRPTGIGNWDTVKDRVRTVFLKTPDGPEFEKRLAMLGNGGNPGAWVFDAVGLGTTSLVSGESLLAKVRGVALKVASARVDSSGRFLWSPGETEAVTLTGWDDATRTAAYTYDYATAPDDRPVVTGTVRDLKSAARTHCTYEADTQTGLISRAECTVRNIATWPDRVETQTHTYVMTESLAP